MDLYSIISIISIICSLILGGSVFYFAPRRFLGKLYLSGIILLLITEVGILMIFLQKDFYQIEFLGKIAGSGLCLALPTWLMISQVYGRANYLEILKKRKWYLLSLYGISLVCLGLLWHYECLFVPDTFPSDLFVVNHIGKYLFIFALINTVLILINFENNLRLTKIAPRRWKKLPIFVLIGAFLFWVYAISQILMYSAVSRSLVLAGLFVIILTNLVLISFSVKYGFQTLFEATIGREVVYSSAMIFIVGVYLLIIGLVGKIVAFAGGSMELFLSFLAAFFLFCLFLAMLVSKSLKQRIKDFIDKNFYQNRYDYREQWGKFSESLSEVLNIDEVLKTVIENITGIFAVDRAAILLTDEDGTLRVRKTRNIQHISNVKFFQKSKFIDWLHRFGEAIETKTLIDQADQIGLTDQEQQHLDNLQARVCIPLIIQRRFIGILTLGEKNSSRPYSREDFDLLETVANQSSVAILNARLNEELMVTHEMESFHKLSSFVLHDLKNSVSMLSMIMKNAEKYRDDPEFQRDMLVTVAQAVDRMKSLISKISTLPDQLHPRKQMIQLNDLIAGVLDATKIEEFDNIKLKKDYQKLPALAVDPHQIRKVIENLVINAIEAQPDGGSLKIATRFVSGNNGALPEQDHVDNGEQFVEIEIEDTGVGMSDEFIQQHLFKPFQTTKRKGLGIGLYQCKEIILAHGGTIDVRSRKNQGTTFRIRLPADNSQMESHRNQQPKYENAVVIN